jgi:hypothetical protein
VLRAVPTAILITLRSAEVIAISDADTFFTELAENVASLASLEQRHRLNREARYVVDVIQSCALGRSAWREATSSIKRTYQR